MTKKLSRADLMAIISHLQGVIGAAHGVAMNDRHPDRAARVDKILRHGLQVCIDVRSTEPPSFGSRSPMNKLTIPEGLEPEP